MSAFGHWDVSAVGSFNPSDFFGFIYSIEHLPTGRTYIGKKQFKFKRKRTKKNAARSKVSDWLTYTSSCAPLIQLIEDHGERLFAFRILKLCSGRCELGYSELEMQFACDVLRATLPNGQFKYFNKTVGYRNYAGLGKQTDQTRRRLAGEPEPEPSAAQSFKHLWIKDTLDNRELDRVLSVVTK